MKTLAREAQPPTIPLFSNTYNVQMFSEEKGSEKGFPVPVEDLGGENASRKSRDMCTCTEMWRSGYKSLQFHWLHRATPAYFSPGILLRDFPLFKVSRTAKVPRISKLLTLNDVLWGKGERY